MTAHWRMAARYGIAAVLAVYVVVATWSSVTSTERFCHPRGAVAGAAVACTHDRPVAGMVQFAVAVAVVLVVGLVVRCVRRLGRSGVILVWLR